MPDKEEIWMDRSEMLRHIGSMQQLAYVRPLIYKEGRAGGMQAYEVKNGPLDFTVMADKCLDLTDVSWKGYNVSFLSKTGLIGRNHYDTNGGEALCSIMGGMLFTCGLENICAPCIIERKDYPMHGRMRTTPAERINEGFREEPMMLLYHFNVGYPLLSEDCQVVLPTTKVIPRDEAAENHTESWMQMEQPIDNEPEYVFLHELAADAEENTFAAVINEKLGIGIKLQFNQKYLPYFMQWKSVASGDYVVGLEPAICFLSGNELEMVKTEAEILSKKE